MSILKNIKLSPREQLVANAADATAGALGYNPRVDLLTKVLRGVSEQVFPIIRISDFMPVVVGQGAWNTELLKIQSYYTGDDFETGVINTAENNSRLAEVSSAAGTLSFPIFTWAKSVTWSIPQLEQAAQTGVYDVIEQGEKSRKTNWNLGIQKIAFLGSPTLGAPGLLVSGTTPVNSSVIPAGKKISTMTPEEYSAAVAGFISAYRIQTNYTANPDRFIIPEDDFLGMSSPTSPVYPIVNKLEYLENAFKQQTMNPNFKVLPSFYAMTRNSGLAKDRYTMYRSDVESLAFQIPVDYTNTLANTINGFQLQNVAFGQFSGTCIFRQNEVMYFEAAS